MGTLLTKLQRIGATLKARMDGLPAVLPPWAHSIRFKLAFTYSLILFFFAAGLVLTFNVYMGQNYRQDPVQRNIQREPFFAAPPAVPYDFNALRLEEKLRIREIRLNDLRRIQQLSIYSLLPLAISSFAVGYYFSGKYLDPLANLRANIEKLETKDLGIELATSENDEVGSLIASFNNLSTRLREAFQSQEQFVQNASHELRTPLAIIQTNLDTALDNPQITQSQLRDAVQQALIGAKQLTKLVNYLLELTARPSAEKLPVDFIEIAKTQVALLSDKFAESGYQVQTQLPAGKLFVQGDQLLLERVLQNLIENAVKYSVPVKGKHLPIQVHVRKVNTECIVSISNGSLPIPAAKLKRIFERFFQVDPSRSKRVSGYGLGLAIVKKIVEEHQGVVSAINANNITTIEVVLPLVPKKSKPSYA